MKTVLAALNSSYIHMSLAPWYLKAACGPDADNVKVMEFTVNRSLRETLHALAYQKPDLIGFSCYIFNIVQIESLVNALKTLLPHVYIVLGGPEVSYDAGNVLSRLKGADFVICGEGEFSFPRLVRALKNGEDPTGIPGLVSRRGSGPAAEPFSVSVKPVSPYSKEMLEASRGRIVYFESSRGCPFRCSYCLSPACGNVRFFPMDYVRAELKKLLRSPARQIKFVDRTFNCNPGRAREIIRLVLECAAESPEQPKNVHFEAAADLFDGETVALLAGAPKGLFQLEIGIQSLNGETLQAVGRKTDLDACRDTIGKLLENGNLHVHLDLIAGLPGEDYASFARSFDGVFAMRSHMLQLGFLKLLKGSVLRRQAEEIGLVFDPAPPYEILSTPWLSFDEIGRLEQIAECVDRLYNSGRFAESLAFLADRFETPFRLFEEFANCLAREGLFERAFSLRELYGLFAGFARGRLGPEDFFVFLELLKYDYYSTDNACSPPDCLAKTDGPSLRELYRAEPGNKSGGRVHYERFAFDPLRFLQTGSPDEGTAVLRFDYAQKDPVSGRYGVQRAE